MGTALGECWLMTGLERLRLLAGAYMALHAVQQVEEVERAGRQSQDVPEILQVLSNDSEAHTPARLHARMTVLEATILRCPSCADLCCVPIPGSECYE